jgi:signal transduction histidine kinase
MDNPDRAERIDTDESLRSERHQTDQALAQTHAAIEDEADTVVRRARANADAILAAARDKADQLLEDPPSSSRPGATLAEERLTEDEVLRDERADADETIRRERLQNARALAKLLPLERDETDRYLLTERARADNALTNRDDFLAIVSHDLRNLLGGIVLSAAILTKRAPENEDGKQIVRETERIKRNAARMNRLIGDLVDVVSIEVGKLAAAPTRGDLRTLVTEAVDSFQVLASAKGLSLESQVPAEPQLADFDHDRLLQVLANLITNAIKFTGKGRKIGVRLERAGTEFRISVRDTGSGIPAEMLEVIFQRFSQVMRNDQRGLGLGLYISRSIVEAHGGRIWCESTQGQGSTFYFTLPVKSHVGRVSRVSEQKQAM